jgi:hypothetical protein
MAYNDAVNNILTADNFYGNNPYSQFSGSPLPWPSSYAGTPTDAHGNPIQAQPGMTLNTPSPALAAAAPQQQQMRWGMISPGGQATGGMAEGGRPEGGSTTPAQYGWLPPTQQQPAAPAAPAPTASSAPGTQGLDSALSLLANPGHVTTPGAQPMAPQGPSVLQSFLANNQGGTGAGNYSNQGFFNTLNALKGATQPGATP